MLSDSIGDVKKFKRQVKQSPSQIAHFLAEHAQVNLDLGCGANKQRGFIGIDARKLPGVDIVHDLERYPWPLANECADLLMASHLLEHINPAKYGFINFMDEAWRVLKPNGRFMIAAPYAGSPGYWQDPTHCNPISEVTWAYFDPLQSSGLYTIYRPRPWKILVNTWHISGNLECVLEKRREDPSYGRNGKP